MIHDDEVGGEAVRLVLRFNDALNAGDVDAAMRLMTDDCIFEAFWEAFFHSSRKPRFDVEEVFGQGDRCVMRWTYHWVDESGMPGHVRGVDIIRLRDGLIAEKLSYVKG
jgi:ketosteroid isomerase-like protein